MWTARRALRSCTASSRDDWALTPCGTQGSDRPRHGPPAPPRPSPHRQHLRPSAAHRCPWTPTTPERHRPAPRVGPRGPPDVHGRHRAPRPASRSQGSPQLAQPQRPTAITQRSRTRQPGRTATSEPGGRTAADTSERPAPPLTAPRHGVSRYANPAHDIAIESFLRASVTPPVPSDRERAAGMTRPPARAAAAGPLHRSGSPDDPRRSALRPRSGTQPARQCRPTSGTAEGPRASQPPHNAPPGTAHLGPPRWRQPERNPP
jgi:hypothetical protein